MAKRGTDRGRTVSGQRAAARARTFVHPVVAARRRLRARMAETGSEQGFSLIELLIVVAILPIIMGGLAAALLAVFGLQSRTMARIGDSNDALVASANFNKDIQSAEQITTVASPTACGSGTQLLALAWSYNASVPGTFPYQTVVSYAAVQIPGDHPIGGTGSSWALVRQLCTFGPSSTPSSKITLARDIGTPGPTMVSITPSAVQTAAAAGWTSAQGVTNVTFDINAPGSGYHYQLVGLPGQSTSTGAATQLQPTGSSGCNFANAGTGLLASTLCFGDFTNWANNPSPDGTTCPASDNMSLGIANTPYTLSFCAFAVQSNTVISASIPTYYNPSGYNSEAFLGNNGFYSGIPGKPAVYQSGCGCSNGALTTVYFSNIQLKNAQGDPVTGWTIVTGDAESTDTNEWMVFSSNVNWDILPNNGANDMWGNDCYNSSAPNGYAYSGLLQYTGSMPATGASVASSTAPLLINANANYATGVNQILCQANQQLNKTGTIMLAAPEPANSGAAQTLTVSMQGAGYQGLFLGVLL